MVTITESGMSFGPFPEDRVYHIEKAETYMDLGKNVRSVEFLYRKSEEKLFFIEAKKSSPLPETDKFEEYINEISEKFIHSFNLWMTLNLKRRDAKVSPVILNVPIQEMIFRFVLVIKGHEISWLPPIKAALERKMMAEIKIWKHQVIAINDDQARKRGLIKEREILDV